MYPRAVLLMALTAAATLPVGCKDHRDQTHASAAKGTEATPPAKPAARPRLVVLVVVDQLPIWSFERDRALLDGGIRRLLDDGVYYRHARYPYAGTFTAPGHAALGTGAPPSVTGILANEWYHRDGGDTRSAVADPAAPLLAIGVPGLSPPDPGDTASPAQLAVDGVGDELVHDTGGRGHAVAVGLKDRSTVLVLGRHPTMAVFYDPSQPAMTTSSYYAAKPPQWLVDLARQHPVSAHEGDVWKPTDAELLRRQTGISDDGPGEGGAYGLGPTFPHRLAATTNPAKALRETPAGNAIVFEAARAALAGEDLGTDDVPDILALLLSAHDYAGHDWGQESWERLDLFLRLDDSLGSFFDELDRRVGKGKWAAVLTSDHGVTHLVEETRADGGEARRIDVEEIEATGEKAAAKVLGKGDWIAAVSAGTIYVTDAFRNKPEARREAALDAITEAVGRMKDVALAERTDRLRGHCDTRHGVDAMACRGLHPTLSGEIFVAPQPGSVITKAKYLTGTTHGSYNPDDTDVPIIVYAPGQPPRVVDQMVSTLQVAPTLARMLGVSPPPAAKALPLP